MIVTAITCTRGRHSLLERCVGLFLNQDYEGMAYQLIYNNSPVKQELAPNLDTDNKKVILVNQSISNRTREPYSSMGDIFADALNHLPNGTEVVTLFDDDDIFLPNHLSEGVRGYRKARELQKIAYKPYYSLMDDADGRRLHHNLSEPSIFVAKEWIQRMGFSSHSSAHHHQWINPIIELNALYEPLDGTPTFVYQWVGGCYHISALGDDPDNLENHHKASTDEGDGIITPIL